MLHKIMAAIDRMNDRLGVFLGWLVLLMVGIAVAVVVLRYVFDMGFVWMQELYVWIHGILFTLGAGYTLRHNKHVRVDIVYASGSARFQRWVNILGTVFLLFPMLGVIAWTSFPYIAKSWAVRESSYQVGGMPGVFVLKTMLLAFCVLLALQALSLLFKQTDEGDKT